MQDDLQIVDHQVEHDADLGRAHRVGRKPVRLDELRPREQRLQRAEGRVEPLDVPDLKGAAAGVGEFGQRAGVGGGFGDGFFDEEVLAAFEQEASQWEVRRRRRGDGRGVYERGELLQRRGGLRPVERGDRLRLAKVGVVNGGEANRSTRRGGEFGINARVQLADVADPDDADTQGVHSTSMLAEATGCNRNAATDDLW